MLIVHDLPDKISNPYVSALVETIAKSNRGCILVRSEEPYPMVVVAPDRPAKEALLRYWHEIEKAALRKNIDIVQLITWDELPEGQRRVIMGAKALFHQSSSDRPYN